MLRGIFRFELRLQTGHGLFLGSTFFLFLLSFMIVATDTLQWGGAVGNAHRNSPFAIVRLLAYASMLGLLLTTAFVATAATRDYAAGTAEILFATRVRKFDYLVGRFAGAYCVSVLAFGGAILGAAAGAFAPWLDGSQVGPFRWLPFAYALVVFVLPNLLVMGAIFFALASLTRSLLATYVALVGLLVCWGVSQNLLSGLDSQLLAVLLDPFGFAAFENATRYWTAFDRNTRIPGITGPLLAGRLVWAGVGALVFAFAYLRFRFVVVGEQKGRPMRRRVEEVPALPVRVVSLVETRTFDAAAHLASLVQQVRVECSSILRGTVFMILLAVAVINAVAASGSISAFVGTDIYPVTYMMLRMLGATFFFLLPVILAFYAGEAVWRERAHELHEVYGALPVPNWVYALSKLLALFLVVLIVSTVGALTTIAIQVSRGYFHLELGLYARGLLYGEAIPMMQIAVLALFLQVMTGHKFVGYALMVAFLLSSIALNAVGWDHGLYRYAGPALGPYSDMNGYGHFLKPRFWYGLYWSCAAVAMATASIVFWPRGTDTFFARRWKAAQHDLKGGWGLAFALAVLSFAGIGAYIYYNTNVLNKYLPREAAKRSIAEYEKRYGRYRALPLPRIVRIETQVDIFPRDRAVRVRGHYALENRTAESIAALHVTVSPGVLVGTLSIPGGTLGVSDSSRGYFVLELSEPFLPGGQSQLDFDLRFETQGFTNTNSVLPAVYNGTFFTNQDVLPRLGYQPDRELRDPADRRRCGLDAREDLPPTSAPGALDHGVGVTDAAWVEFETVVSTAPEQIALAPGALVREWNENGRRFFHYKVDAPMINFHGYLSAEYEVYRRRWRDVSIEVYYDEAHFYNVERMADAVERTLEYMSERFGPYDHPQLRIVEFPRYSPRAVSFAGIIPFSEGLGFIADLSDREKIDFVFHVTAHEVAHQWGHRIIPAAAEGATFIVETLAQYFALMVVEREYGPEMTRGYLRHELDSYLRSRGGDSTGEQPLGRVHHQGYIHYNKGSVVMYALREHLGEDALNRAIARFADQVEYMGPPYASADALIKEIRAVTPDDRKYLIEDLLETITLHDFTVTGAEYEPQSGSGYRVRIEYEARKLRADEQGQETEIPISDWVDVGVFGQKTPPGAPQVLYLEQHHITDRSGTLEVVVRQEPASVGVDPFNLLIDRNPDDNRYDLVR